MRVDIISDVHVYSAHDPAYARLLAFLKLERDSGDSIVFAGDIFDVWIGAKADFKNRYIDFFNTLSQLKQRGLTIHFLQGNHDFGFGSLFINDPHITVHDRPLTIQDSHPSEDKIKSLFIDHGDLVQSDFGYRLLRFLFRSRFFQWMVRCAPLSWIDWVGNRMSRYGFEKHPRLPETWKPEDLERLRFDFRSFAKQKWEQGYQAVVLGHCHDSDSWEDTQKPNGNSDLSSRGHTYRYMNVGFPRVHNHFVRWISQSGELQRLPF